MGILVWLYVWALLIAACMFASNYTGYRFLSFSSQQQWSPGGHAVYHK